MKGIFILILIIVIQFDVHSQNISAGVGVGTGLLIFEDDTENGFGLDFYLDAALSRTYTVEIRPGFYGANNYVGAEFGSYLKLFPFNNTFFFITGLDLHFNQSGGGISSINREELFILPTIGLGFKGLGIIHKVLNIELVYQKPFPNGLTYAIVGNESHYKNDFLGIINLNIAFIWQL